MLECIEEKSTLLNNILRSKVNWTVHFLRRNCLFHDATEGQVMEVKGVGGRKTQLLGLRSRRYLELKEEAKVRKRWTTVEEICYLPQVQ